MLRVEFEDEGRRLERRTEQWLNAFAYFSRIAVNLLSVLVLLMALRYTSGPFETLVVALIGALYIALRAIFVGMTLMFGRLGLTLARELDTIYRRLDPAYRPAPAPSASFGHWNATMRWKAAIDVFFLSVMGLICVWWMYSGR